MGICRKSITIWHKTLVNGLLKVVSTEYAQFMYSELRFFHQFISSDHITTVIDSRFSDYQGSLILEI